MSTLKSCLPFARNLRYAILQGIFPPRCAGCGGWHQGLFCDACRLQLLAVSRPLCDVCGQAFDRLAKDVHLCAECRPNKKNPLPAFIALRSKYDFEGPIRKAIHRFKYQGQTSLSEDLADELCGFWQQDCGGTLSVPCCDVITGVPLHWWRKHRRGYNQSDLIAQHLASRLNVSFNVLLQRTRPTRPQVELTRDERAENVKNAFRAIETRKPEIKGKTVLLIDDVCTTSATLRECAKALKKGGAGSIYALTLARKMPELRERNGSS